jgi:hypothetical protein
MSGENQVDEVTTTCAKCRGTLTRLPVAVSYFVAPKDRSRGMLRTGSKPAWQCRACGQISGDAEFIELNRGQRRAADRRQKAGKR